MRLDGLLLRLDNCRILLGSRFFVAFEPRGGHSIATYTVPLHFRLTSDLFHCVLYFILFHFLLSSLYGTYLLLFAQPDGRTSDDRRVETPRSPRATTACSSTVRSPVSAAAAGSTAGPGPDRARPRSADAIGIARTSV